MNKRINSTLKITADKLKFVVFLLCVLFTITKSTAQAPAFFNSNSGSPSNSFPFATAAGKQLQSLVAPGEFVGAYFGNITNFYVQCTASQTVTWTTFVIKMGQTTATTLPTGVLYTPLTTVFSAASYTGSTNAAGWIKFTLQTPFLYDPTKSLVIDISQCSASSTGMLVINTSKTGFRRTYVNAASCVFTYSGQDANIFNCGIDEGSAAFNDAGVVSIDSPSTFCGGQQTIKATIKNFGRNPVNPVTVKWSLNGVQQTPLTYSNLLDTMNGAGSNTAQVTLGTYTFPSSPLTTIKAWTSNPNNVTDTVPLNDTATAVKGPSISGTYTINPSGSGSNNFTSFTAAANAINAAGVCGPVYITVSPGTYNEKFTLTNVQGTSAINTITIDGVDSSNRIITYNETTAAANIGIISLIGTSYVTIKNLRIINTGVSYGAGVSIQSGSNYNLVTGCRIDVAANATTTSIFGVGICGSTYTTASTGSNNTIRNCKIQGGYMGVVLYGSSTTVVTPGNKVLSCDISLCGYYGIYCYYQINTLLNDNRINLTNATNTYGIMAYYSQNDTIDRNIILASYMGLYIYYNNYYGNQSATAHSSISNNIVNLNGNYVYSTNYGLYTYYNYTTDFKHNTIYTAPSVSSGYCVYMYYGGNCVYKNNIFQSNNASMYAVYSGSIPTAPFEFDYNILYSPSTNLVYWLAAYSSLSALKAATPGFNQNCLYKIPNYANSLNKQEDLHLSTTSAADQAEISSALTVDVDGEARCMLAPSIGADDSKFGAGAMVANFSVQDTVFVNSPTTFANYVSKNTPSYKQWFLDGVLVSTAHDFQYTFTSTGTYNIKLKMIGCFVSDSIVKSITVYNLTQKPIANFIADINTVPTNQNVNFKDLTTKGPAYWQWNVIPAVGVTFVNGTNSNSQNPVMRFANAGLYTICLWDSNALGRSNTACKTSYILVQATTNLCAGPTSTKVASGNIFDDGGQAGNYNTNKSCSFLIDPCATSVTLKFNNFSLASGSFFRAYNGIDNTAPALHSGTGFTGVGNPTTITASSGKMFIEFVTGATADVGFDASWTSVAGTYAPPSGTVIDPDTADDCGSLNTFTFVSNDAFFNKDAADYSWYFTNSQLPTYSGTGLYSVQYGFTTAGIYPVKLEVNGCGGVSTFYDTVRVITPSGAPIIDFKANTTRATVTDIILLTDISKYGTTSRSWAISGPGTAIDVQGDNTQSIYGVRLNTPGTYTVTLTGSNCKGTAQLTRTSYITIFNYCQPIVTNLNVDFAIKTVTFGRIDTIVNGEIKGFDYTNISPALGTVGYRDNTTKIKNYTFGTKAVEAVVELGGSYPFSVTRAGNLNTASTNIWIDLNQDGTFQSTELVASSAALSGSVFSGTVTIPTNATLGTTRMRIGTSVGLQSNLPCGANLYGDFNDYRVRVTPDLSAPVIKFNGNDTLYVEVGRLFNDPGYTVVDNITNPCPNTVTGITGGTQITTHPFSSSYTVTATDAANNVSTRRRIVMSSPDITKPVINMNGVSPITVAVGSIYTDAGATATDFFFGSLTSSIVANSTVNTAVTGTYTVTYNVTDAAGNIADVVVRTVIVRDTQKPVITVTGANPLYVEVLSNFTAPVATVTDNYCTGLTYNVTGTVNANVLGTYTLTYTATDCSGNDAVPVVLTVIVRDTKAPSLLFIVGDTIVIDVKTLTTVPEPGYVLTDNYYNQNQLTLTVNYSGVNLNVVGNYAVRYYVSDPSGNMDSSHIRVYKVLDRIAPVINLIGSSYIDWKRWTAYVDPGTIVTDNYYTNLIASVDASQVNIYVDGLYPVKYNITDPSGNKAVEVIRNVRVYTAPSGINNNTNSNLFTIYPNPNNGLVNIDLNLDNADYANITITDINGKVVLTKTINQPSNDKLQFDLSNNANGMYFINVVTNNYSNSKSFTINK